MKKNTLTLVLVLVAGLSLLTVATVAASSTNTGYEQFKDIMKDIEHAEQGEMDATIQVTDNGSIIMTGDISAVGGKESEEGSGNATFSINGTDKSFDFYKTDDSLYVIDQLEEGYYQMVDDSEMDERYEKGRGRRNMNDEDRDMTEVEEEILDYMVGDLKDNFVVTDSLDGTEIRFAMEGAEVPELVNLIVKAGSAAEHRDMTGNKDEMMTNLPFMDGVDHDVMPDLVEDVKIETLQINVSLNDNNEAQAFNLVFGFSGSDAEDVFHNVEVTVNSTFNASNQNVEVLDIDAYEWEVIEHASHQ